MALDKSIEHGREHRKQYRGSKSFARTCRNHGTCDWCRENRMYSTIRDNIRISQEECVDRIL